MAWIVLLSLAVVMLAGLRYGADSRDGLDWRTTAGPTLRQQAAPPFEPRASGLARRASLRADLVRMRDALRAHRSQPAR